MLQPKKQKYRKQFRGHMGGSASRGNTLNFGEYGLKAISRGWLSAKQIEAARKAITHYSQRGGKVWIRVFPDKPITKKALGTRMGSGKGDIVDYVAVVTPGRIIFEIAGVPEEVARTAFRRAIAKLPFKFRVISKND
ncbi:MAG: 50S ribosomal protein L16 [Candidatus Amesbacteria bacterium GW2011_GWB1_47_26]|uniref:Large ribosomal subunit protein uL16 n=1 Tax=Candidatus Amesbacteria bacterium GW2011_GWC2_45_19 TaxID=1618366 RepID=A0A0G1M4U7_9BACT|nr:MAG: 50S ribosomal protein L16 [Candidatus Amesbacteria bacterium GW2011_GWC2_45_19]KKU38755.1 MAG: 50S ribosomal protein L16 [Candidatus Amesbacteria bacterium GW2011_GWA1_46_35]KKU69257.1 MAG: 50S ribosomal protein L16 [Microgenomates group bacterium GW2011_GWC1_47_20]KKU75112.1 MAG: 50S ribosomal protein L16 [Candidatus Amesbacteria bacterium GW2011_GWB1_47_26]KKU80409.1 MAG: 50S ribosomal protein L16 [Candidatus Amesbacteria bacterium GW2011_GWA2_47_70]